MSLWPSKPGSGSVTRDHLCPDMYQALRMTRCYREPVFKDDEVVESTTEAILSRPQDDALPRRASPCQANRKRAPPRPDQCGPCPWRQGPASSPLGHRHDCASHPLGVKCPSRWR